MRVELPEDSAFKPLRLGSSSSLRKGHRSDKYRVHLPLLSTGQHTGHSALSSFLYALTTDYLAGAARHSGLWPHCVLMYRSVHSLHVQSGL